MKKIAIMFQVDDKELNEKLFQVINANEFKDSHITFYHCFEELLYMFMPSAVLYPQDSEREKIQQKTENYIKETCIQYLQEFPLTWNTNFSFSPNPKKELAEKLEHNKYDLVICTTKEMQGMSKFFHSSFTDYIYKNVSSDLLIIK